jgi:hypothetical protein
MYNFLYLFYNFLFIKVIYFPKKIFIFFIFYQLIYNSFLNKFFLLSIFIMIRKILKFKRK